MPGMPPPVPTEKAAIRAFLAQQHDGVRGAAYGLTDEQAHSAPSTSAISIAGLLRHLTVMETAWVHRATAAPAPVVPDARPVEEAAAAYGSDWDPQGETLAALMADFDAMTARTEALVDELDLDTPVPVPRDAPWFPRDVEAWSVRWVWFHLIEEVARHAGHGDIVRESIDRDDVRAARRPRGLAGDAVAHPVGPAGDSGSDALTGAVRTVPTRERGRSCARR